jgi:hypothetical protein
LCAGDRDDNLAPGVAGASGGGDVSFTGSWLQSASTGFYGGNGSLYSADDPSVPDSYTWRTPVLNPRRAAPTACTCGGRCTRTARPACRSR